MTFILEFFFEAIVAYFASAGAILLDALKLNISCSFIGAKSSSFKSSGSSSTASKNAFFGSKGAFFLIVFS